MSEKNIDKIIEELQAKISRCQAIINGLENNESFNMLIQDLKKNIEIIDGNWHLVPVVEHGKLLELRVTKLAAVTLINIIDGYRNDVAAATKALAEIQHPDKIQGSYYDHE